ncbi:hypothetical protein LPW36_04060 [Jinshanibacter sp. LJY008]|uniref:Lipoprotein n=1 Tax=Limnobaculum eriocheiris TaxID=2897391 RepID=A0A9X1SJ70_9GAMM|nr:hypothetical protein [Limnobaculum eriocheiris]MCD1125208.1 hypothetical protein [Limnobaculum eriocheiris]
MKRLITVLIFLLVGCGQDKAPVEIESFRYSYPQLSSLVLLKIRVTSISETEKVIINDIIVNKGNCISTSGVFKGKILNYGQYVEGVFTAGSGYSCTPSLILTALGH